MASAKGSKFKSEIGGQSWSENLSGDCRLPNSQTSKAALDSPALL